METSGMDRSVPGYELVTGACENGIQQCLCPHTAPHFSTNKVRSSIPFFWDVTRPDVSQKL